MVILNFILLGIACILLIPITFFFLECSLAVLPNRQKPKINQTHQPTFVVLVPAHNEEPDIANTLNELISQVARKDSILVIADNCTDNTAEIARNKGITVIERHNTQLRGKGYALAYALQFVQALPPDVVVFVDADCRIAPDTLNKIVNLAYTTQRPVQATYLMDVATHSTPKDSLSTLAVIIKNLVRPFGLAQLNLPCLLNGSGMAFPWTVIRQVSLESSKTVDDMQLSVDLALAGYSALYCSEGRVTGRLMQQEAATSQRSRWEHGHIEMILTEVPRLIKAAIIQKRFELLILALEISVPPLSLLIMVWLVAFSWAILWGFWQNLWLSAFILALEGMLIFVSIAIAWIKFGRSEISGLMLLAFPFYILKKIPIYLAFWFNSQARWLKTERDTHP